MHKTLKIPQTQALLKILTKCTMLTFTVILQEQKREKIVLKKCILAIACALVPCFLPAATYIGSYNTNKYDSNSVNNPYGTYGSKYSSDSINNPYGQYGSKYSSNSVSNPYTTDAPKLYDQNGNYRGKLSANKYDPESVSNPYGRYGSKYSPDSINNPYGAGNPYSTDVISIYGR